MEFLDINLTKDSCLLLAIHSPFMLSRFYSTPYSSLKIHTKKSVKQENSSISWIAICRTEKGVENQTKTIESEKTQVHV